MKYASDFRTIARDSLRGRWLIAVLVGLVAVLLGGAGSSGPKLKLNFDGSGANISLDMAGQSIMSTAGGIGEGLRGILVGASVFLIVAALIFAVAYFILGSIVEVGYSEFNLRLVDGQEASFEHLFAHFGNWRTAALTRLLSSVYILLWSLLFIIPGIVASYSYAMTGYILAEHPELTPGEAIQRSRQMMTGNRWRLFCLQFSFIGWAILSALTLGIGNLWLNPYRQAATAAFYREVSCTEWRVLGEPADGEDTQPTD